MARLAAEGHRVVLVVATSGERGLAAPVATAGRNLGEVRMAETRASARALGCARVEFLGYADSGLDGQAEGLDGQAEGLDGQAEGLDGQAAGGPGQVPFARADLDEAAARLAALLREEQAALLTTYDPAGGYGHPDHVQVHRVGARAAEMAGTPLVLQATVDRDLLTRALRLVRRVYPLPIDPAAFAAAYTPRSAITHRINVRGYLAQKRQSMSAHATQTTGGETVRTLAALLRLPRFLFRLALGTEWYVQPGLPRGGGSADVRDPARRDPVLRDPLATLLEG
jgi:LmbE family N-acetylglucosaminyl deacetylase